MDGPRNIKKLLTCRGVVPPKPTGIIHPVTQNHIPEDLNLDNCYLYQCSMWSEGKITFIEHSTNFCIRINI